VQTIAIVLLASGAVPRADATQAESDVVVKTTHVAGSVYMLEGQGGNIGACVGNDGILIIDNQFAPLADKIRSALRMLNPGPLKFVLNTHYHGDHVGGNPTFGKEATIVAHENVRKRVMTKQEGGGRVREALDPAGWPVVTFEDAVTIHFNGEDIRFFHLPAGHTDGDGLVFFPNAKVLHMGDLLFSGRFPVIDWDGGGTVEGYLKNLEWVLQNFPKDVKVIPGHGPLSTMEDVTKLHKLIADTSAYVKKQVEDGKSLDEIKKKGLPEEYTAFDWQLVNVERWIETLHRAYSQ
jgi:glyoxylase-like metal-dependent hydrolase (beta-lactamase superfamily II)